MNKETERFESMQLIHDWRKHRKKQLTSGSGLQQIIFRKESQGILEEIPWQLTAKVTGCQPREEEGEIVLLERKQEQGDSKESVRACAEDVA